VRRSIAASNEEGLCCVMLVVGRRGVLEKQFGRSSMTARDGARATDGVV
jgi:hypothetical protein